MDISKTRFYVGTARGVLLGTGDKPTDIKAHKNEETTAVSALSDGRNPSELILGYESGFAHIFDIEKETFTKKIDNLEGDEGVVGLSCLKNKLLVIGKKDGVINIWSKKKNDYFSLDLDESGSLLALSANKNKENIIGTGGEHNDLKLWNIESKQCIFKAKSLGHDHLQLPIPTSVRGIAFFNHEPSLVACCTKEGHVLLYDERAQRKPTIKFHEEKASYSSISSTFKDTQVFVGTTKGYLQWLDLRQSAKVLKTYTTFTGAVTDVVCDPLEPFVASVSLDRHLRVHNCETKELKSKIYMKQNLTKLLVKPIVKDEEPKQAEAQVLDQEYEDLFNNMEEVHDGHKKTKRKSDGVGQKIKKKRVKNA
ncbi:WD repeat-containing protein 74 [Anthonomus grandis grandis]|uniref:WD repeat-containing protein 74 n=1 Tax=Anthonomus grandis grandis TaxID=2921223 RepID=UPI0021666B27|nr:WD repeat-containing protein 74 [Anthonomus grandis grandis]